MKRLFSGFTMAEALITLGIIGVIASMTLPALQNNTQKQQIGPALAKGVNTVQNAVRLILREENARTLYDLYGTGVFTSEFQKSGYVMLTTEPEQRSFRKLGSDELVTLGNCVVGNDNVAYCPPTEGYTYNINESNKNLDKKFDGRGYVFYIDTNGAKKPNTIGIDVHKIFLDAKGIVVPYGGYAYKEYSGEETYQWKEKCNNNSQVTDADACAGAIADNNWQVKYRF